MSVLADERYPISRKWEAESRMQVDPAEPIDRQIFLPESVMPDYSKLTVDGRKPRATVGIYLCPTSYLCSPRYERGD